MTSPNSQPAKDNAKLNPFLWFHLALMAIAPWLLVMTMAGLAVGDPLLPSWLEILILGLPAIALPAWWQWQQPFSPFSLWLAAKPSENLSDRDRQMLALLKQQNNGWYITGWIAISIAMVTGVIFAKLYDLAPLAQAIAPFPNGLRFFGIIYAEICLFLSNIFLQSGISSLRLYLVTEPELDNVQPIAIAKIKNSFTSLNLLPVNIAEPLLKLFDLNESEPNPQDLAEPSQPIIPESQAEALPVLEVPEAAEVSTEIVLEPIAENIDKNIAEPIQEFIDQAIVLTATPETIPNPTEASDESDKHDVCTVEPEIQSEIADSEIVDSEELNFVEPEIEPETVVDLENSITEIVDSEELNLEDENLSNLSEISLVSDISEESQELAVTTLEANSDEETITELLDIKVDEPVDAIEITNVITDSEQGLEQEIEEAIAEPVQEIVETIEDSTDQVLEELIEEPIIENNQIATEADQLLENLIEESIVEIDQVLEESIQADPEVVEIDQVLEESIQTDPEVAEPLQESSTEIVHDNLHSPLDNLDNAEADHSTEAATLSPRDEISREDVASSENQDLVIDANANLDANLDVNLDINQNETTANQALDLPVTNPSTTASKPKSFAFNGLHKAPKHKSKTHGFGRTVKQETIATPVNASVDESSHQDLQDIQDIAIAEVTEIDQIEQSDQSESVEAVQIDEQLHEEMEEELDERAVLDHYVENILYDYFSDPSDEVTEETGSQNSEQDYESTLTPTASESISERKPNKYLVEEFLMDKFFAKLEKLNSSDRLSNLEPSNPPVDELSEPSASDESVNAQSANNQSDVDEFDALAALIERDQTPQE